MSANKETKTIMLPMRFSPRLRARLEWAAKNNSAGKMSQAAYVRTLVEYVDPATIDQLIAQDNKEGVTA